MKARIILSLVLMLTFGSVFGQTRTKKAAAKPAAKTATTKPIGAWINFNGGEDVSKISVSSKYVYVAMKYTKRMVAIEKTTGKLKEVKSNNEISGVAVAADTCYYYVDREGIFRFDPEAGTSEGPLFGIVPEDWNSPKDLFASPNGKYLLCGDLLIDIPEGEVVSQPGVGCAVNDLGGVYIKNPEAWYAPLGEDRYKVSAVGTCVHQLYPDAVTGNVYYCMDEGIGFTPMVPQPGAGVTRIQTSFETGMNIANCITRDDEGNFVVETNFEGIGFGGKNIEDPYRMQQKIASGVKDKWGTELYYSGGSDYMTPDGQGNLIFGSRGYAFVFIYNPKGINGYSELKGKAVRF